MMKKVLLVGGSGFIGRNIQEFFAQNDTYQVIAPSSKSLNCIDENQVLSYIGREYYDIVLNFAIYGDGIDKSKDPNKMVEYNLRMYFNFANHNDLYGKMFYAGSGAEYNKAYPICSVKEDDIGKSVPEEPYGLMKYVVGRHIEGTSNIYNLRIFGLFGKYEYWPTTFISNVCCKSLYNLPLTIKKNTIFDYLWIDDYVHILKTLMDANDLKYHTYNIVSGKRIDLFSICKIVNDISKKKSRIIVCESQEGNEYTASNTRLLSEFPETQLTPIEDSIESLYQWYEDHINEIDITKLLY